MIKKYLIPALFVAVALLYASCDKVEADANGYYIYYSGAIGDWVDGPAIADHSPHVLLEKYTGVRCLNCPDGDAVIHAAMNTYGSALIPISIHDSSSFTRPYGSDQRLSTPVGNTWSRYFGISSYPTAICNRTEMGGTLQFNPAAGVSAAVEAALSQPVMMALAASMERDGNHYAVTVSLEYLQDYPNPLTVTLLLLEDSVRATQLQPDGRTKATAYLHCHLLREAITNPWGADVDADGHKGTKRQARFTHTSTNPLVNHSHCYIVAFVSDKNTRQILAATECR